jgi:hypothetical protein
MTCTFCNQECTEDTARIDGMNNIVCKKCEKEIEEED